VVGIVMFVFSLEISSFRRVGRDAPWRPTTVKCALEFFVKTTLLSWDVRSEPRTNRANRVSFVTT
jgi:hypothetical protein